MPRNPVIDSETIRIAGRLLSEAAGESRVILFGSYARGDAGEGSDLDFLVIK
ncbi:MAG: nucleotidyltransferase domain-containing protein, partial [Magnetococcales bacterium]|nr:nucleotidyltransferase domain-containing protein [Magnetococcales bacterium]